MKSLSRPCLCLITDRRRLTPGARTTRDEIAALDRWLDEAIDLVDMIQLRERDLEGAAFYELASRVAARARASRTAVVVNTRADVAVAAEADGVHLRADGAPLDRVRVVAPLMLGRSIHDPDDAARQSDADYVMFGTLFSTRSKPATAGLQGIERLGEAVRRSPAPVLAIGGIDPGRAAECLAAGAAGVAAIGTFLPPGREPGAVGITAAVEAFRRAMMVLK